jgi:two-component system LytT family response regulator
MQYTALIVDDEPLGREGLRLLLAEDSEFAAAHEAKNGREAVEKIRSLCPDLVFLDVQMPEMDGLAVVREVGAGHMPAVVFVTAHDKYAIQAFEINAIDYLLKPVTAARFRKTLERAKRRLKASHDGEASRRILSMLETMAAPPRYVKRLAVRSSGKTTFVDVDEIDWMEATENYVELHTSRANPLLHVAMHTLEKSLDPEQFVRIHRSIIVNVRRVKELQPSSHGEYVVTLTTGTRLQSGRMYNARLKAMAANSFPA